MDSAQVNMEEFNKALWDRYHNGKIRNVYPLIKYNDIIEKIKAMQQNPPCNTPGEYYLLRKFIVIKINGKERLSCKPESNSENVPNKLNNPTKYYVALEEIYGLLDDAHKSIRHGCRLVRRIQSQGIVNITRDTVELFLSLCNQYRPRRNQAPRRSRASNNAHILPNSPPDNNEETACDIPALRRNSTDSNSVDAMTNTNRTKCTFTRGFICILDYRGIQDGDYRYVFAYVDIQTCFCALFPLRCMCVAEMSSHLVNTFTLLGPPQVLHSSLDPPLIQSLIKELKRALPESVLVSGSSYDLERVARNCISEVMSMMRLWMSENKTNNWSKGVKLVQLQKNTKRPSSPPYKSPYECFFGHSLNSNLRLVSDLPLLGNATTEDELLNLINEHASSEPYEHLQVSLDPNICELVHTQNRRNVQAFDALSSDHSMKEELATLNESPETNGELLSDSSNNSDSSNFYRVIKEELPDSDG